MNLEELLRDKMYPGLSDLVVELKVKSKGPITPVREKSRNLVDEIRHLTVLAFKLSRYPE